MKKRSNISIPTSVDLSVKKFAESVKENVDVMLGHRGNPVDRAITWRDLNDSGIVKIPTTGFTGAANQVSLPGAEISGAIQTPYNLVASGAFQSVLLKWDLTPYEGHSHVEIWRHTADSLADAILVGISSYGVGIYSDDVGGISTSLTYYYWVRAVNTAGQFSGYNSSAGTLATLAPDVEKLLDVLTGAITTSELASSLTAPISLISADSSTTGSVAYQVAQEATARAAAITASSNSLQSQINELTNIPNYNASTSYVTDDQVVYSNNLYRAKQNTTGNLPTNSTYWELLGNYTGLGAMVGDHASFISAINTITANSGSAASQAIAGLQSTVNDSTTGLAATVTALGGLTTRVTTAEGSVTSNANEITTLKNTVNNATTGVVATSNALDTVETLVNHAVTGVTASANKISALETTVNNATTGVVATTTALNALTTRVTNTEGDITSNASSVTTLKATVNTKAQTFQQNSAPTATGSELITNGNFNSNINDWTGSDFRRHSSGKLERYQGSSNSYAGQDFAIESGVTYKIEYDVVHNGGNNLSNVYIDTGAGYITRAGYLGSGHVIDYFTAVTTKTLSFRLYGIGNFRGTFDNVSVKQMPQNTGDIWINSSNNNELKRWNGSTWVSARDAQIATNSAAITAEQTARADADTALTSSINTLTSTVSGHATSIQTNTSSVNGLEGKYTVKIDNNGALAGFGLASTANSAGNITSEFIVNADRFAIMRGGSNTTAATVPFAVQSTNTTINGESVPAGIYIADGYIKNGSIVKAKIGDAAIDNAKISSLSANKITFGVMNGDRIDTNTLNGNRIETDSLDVAGKAIQDSIGRIAGIAGQSSTANGQNIQKTEIVRSVFSQQEPKHIAGYTTTSASPTIYAGSVLNGLPLFKYYFKTYNFTGNRSFLIQCGIDYQGTSNTRSESIFAVAMRQTSNADAYTSTSNSSYIFTDSTSGTNVHAVTGDMINRTVVLAPNKDYYIWCFGMGDDGVSHYESGYINVFGLNS